MNRPGENLFRAVCLGFSALLLVGSLFLGIRMAALNDAAAENRRRAETLRQENALLRARCECSLSLEEIERYAREELGMQYLSGEQMIRAENPVG
jgi:hypothetical protein